MACMRTDWNGPWYRGLSLVVRVIRVVSGDRVLVRRSQCVSGLMMHNRLLKCVRKVPERVIRLLMMRLLKLWIGVCSFLSSINVFDLSGQLPLVFNDIHRQGRLKLGKLNFVSSGINLSILLWVVIRLGCTVVNLGIAGTWRKLLIPMPIGRIECLFIISTSLPLVCPTCRVDLMIFWRLCVTLTLSLKLRKLGVRRKKTRRVRSLTYLL